MGASANLPDCRAYELVTPRDTHGSAPLTANDCPESSFGEKGGSNARMYVPEQDTYTYCITASLGDGLGNGYDSVYRAHRSADGWSSTFASPTTQEARHPDGLQLSADNGYQVFGVDWQAPGWGTLAIPGPSGSELESHWLRHPDGTYTLIGQGALPANPDTDGYDDGLVDAPGAVPIWISANATHQIFQANIALTPDAAPTSTGSATRLYDRTASGLHLISLLPGDVTPAGFDDANVRGVADDGSVVLFALGGHLYARVNDATTLDLSSQFDTSGPNVGAPGGVTPDGTKAFFNELGDLYAYDIGSQQRTQITNSGDAHFVNVSQDGSHVFFYSPSQLDGSNGVTGQPNLYVWDGRTTRFIATVNSADLNRINTSGGFSTGLADYENNVGRKSGFLAEASRVTPDGSVFVFESTAQLTSYDNAGHREIYRYDVSSGDLSCASCNPSGAPAQGDAQFSTPTNSEAGTRQETIIQNLTDDGHMVFFESSDALVPQDNNGTDDVYEWHDGQISLLSSGTFGRASRLVSVNPSGRDVFIRTGAALVPNSQESGIDAIYDARIDGGLAVDHQADQPCVLDSCQQSVSLPPLLGLATQGAAGSGNATPAGIVTPSVRVLGFSFKNGRVVLRVHVPSAGILRASGSRTVAIERRATRAGSVTVRLRLTRGAQRQLSKLRRLNVMVHLRFLPRIGVASTATAKGRVARPLGSPSRHRRLHGRGDR